MRTLTEHDPVMMGNGDLKELKDVGGDPYTLPTATASRLGGVKVGSGLSVSSAGVLSTDGGSYTLPAATAETLGGVKVGSGLSVAEDGTLSNAQSYTLPAATAETLGGVKVGSGLSVAEDGTLSASGGGGSLTPKYTITVPAQSTSALVGADDGVYFYVAHSSAFDTSYAQINMGMAAIVDGNPRVLNVSTTSGTPKIAADLSGNIGCSANPSQECVFDFYALS